MTRRCTGRCARMLPLDAFPRDRAALAANPTARRSRRRHAPALAALTPDPDPDPEAAERAARIAAMADSALKRRSNAYLRSHPWAMTSLCLSMALL